MHFLGVSNKGCSPFSAAIGSSFRPPQSRRCYTIDCYRSGGSDFIDEICPVVSSLVRIGVITLFCGMAIHFWWTVSPPNSCKLLQNAFCGKSNEAFSLGAITSSHWTSLNFSESVLTCGGCNFEKLKIVKDSQSWEDRAIQMWATFSEHSVRVFEIGNQAIRAIISKMFVEISLSGNLRKNRKVSPKPVGSDQVPSWNVS